MDRRERFLAIDRLAAFVDGVFAIVGPVLYSVAIALSFVAPLISLTMFVLIAIGYWAEGPVAGVDEGYAMAGESVAGEPSAASRHACHFRR